MDWSAEQIDQLRTLWDEGELSAAQIGVALGFGPDGKNKVIGKAHRLGLRAKPSPITHWTEGWTEVRMARLRQMKASYCSQRYMARQLGISVSAVQKQVTRMGLGVALISGVTIVHSLPPLKSLASREMVMVKPVPKPVAVVVKKPVPVASFGACCWVTGHKQYCDAP